MISSIIPVFFFLIKIQPNMSEREKKRLRISDLLNDETIPPKKKFRNNRSFFVFCIQNKEYFITLKDLFLLKRGCGGHNLQKKNPKRKLFTATSAKYQ